MPVLDCKFSLYRRAVGTFGASANRLAPLLQLALFAVVWLVLASGVARAQEPDLHGLIELGGSDIKSVILQLTRTDIERIEKAYNEHEDAIKFRLIDKNTKRLGRFDDEKVSAERPENTSKVIEAVRHNMERMTAEFGVPAERIYVVASSGVAKAAHFSDLKGQLQKQLPGVELRQVTAESECALTFRWITPRRHYLQVVIIDIGSANVKACYFKASGQPGQPPQMSGFELLPWGTKTFAKRVQDKLLERGLDAGKFSEVAHELGGSEVRQQLDKVKNNYPGLSSLPSLYLVGGIVWATSNLTHPCPSNPDWGTFKTSDITMFANRIKKGTSYYYEPACTKNKPDLQKTTEKVVNDIQQTFSPEQLLAGTELLQTMSEQLLFNQKSAIVFASVARDSWRTQLLADIILDSPPGADPLPVNLDAAAKSTNMGTQGLQILILLLVIGSLAGGAVGKYRGSVLLNVGVGIVGALISGAGTAHYGRVTILGGTVDVLISGLLGGLVFLLVSNLIVKSSTPVVRATARDQPPGSASPQEASPSQGKVFICYRRDDSRDVTGRIYDRLVKEFGDKSVFRDVDSVPVGLDFRKHVDEKISQCDVCLVVIADGWLTVSDRNGKRRIDDPRDHVRIEIEAALKRTIPVVPLLVGGAVIPSVDELPPSLQELAFRNAIPVRPDPDFHHDVDRLVAGLKQPLLRQPGPSPISKAR